MYIFFLEPAQYKVTDNVYFDQCPWQQSESKISPK